MNNAVHSKPALMSDGRQGNGSYHSESLVDQGIKYNRANVNSNWEYRQYLTNNASSIISTNFRNDLMQNHTPADAEMDTSTPTSNPYLYNGTNDMTSVRPNTFSSDMKQLYLSRQQHEAKMSAPSVYSNYAPFSDETK